MLPDCGEDDGDVTVKLIQPARESRPRAAKATQYHPLERALVAEDDGNDEHDKSPQFVALIASANLSEPYEQQTYRQAIGGGDAKQCEQSMEEEVNSLKEVTPGHSSIDQKIELFSGENGCTSIKEGPMEKFYDTSHDGC
jgi:hypothetical protein